MTELRARVIRLVDKMTAIINVGASDGITPGTEFHILGDPEPIVDPLNSAVLGEVIVLKAKLVAAQIHEHFTIARTRAKATVTSRMLAAVQGFDIEPTEMIVQEKDLKPWKAQSVTPVRVGDEVNVIIPLVKPTGDSKAPTSPAGDSGDQG